MRRGRIELAENAHDLGELLHQAFLVLQPPRRVDEQHVDARLARLRQRVEDEAGGIRADDAGDDGRSRALGPRS